MMSRKFCPVGHILKGVEIIILDDEGNQQPVGKSGEVSSVQLTIKTLNFNQLDLSLCFV